MGDQLKDRIVKVTLIIPVTTPGDFTNVTTDQIEIGGDSGVDQGLRATFKITKTDKKDPNTSQIVITNLNKTSRGNLQKKGVKVILEAGYKTAGLYRLFIGDARTVDHVRSGADWDTTIKVGDGERAYTWARYAESFAEGTGAGDILKRLANASGLEIGSIPDQVANIQATFDHGYVVRGSVSKSLERLAKSLGYVVSIQNGALNILLPGAIINATVPDITPTSGLIGSPEMGTPEKKGKPALLKFKSLLFPTTPGAKVHLKSDRYDGYVVLKKVEYSGDTHGDDWYTSCEGVIAQ